MVLWKVFGGTINLEMYYPNEFSARSELKEAIDVYINFYNNKRLQKRFKNKTPTMVRTKALGREIGVVYPIPTNKKIEGYWSNIRKKMQATTAKEKMIHHKATNHLEYFIHFTWLFDRG